MLGDFLIRLAVALPLICALAVLVLWAAKRGWLWLPTTRPRAPQAPAALELVSQQTLGPAARLAVVRFDGRDHLIGIAGGRIARLASSSRTGSGTGSGAGSRGADAHHHGEEDRPCGS